MKQVLKKLAKLEREYWQTHEDNPTIIVMDVDSFISFKEETWSDDLSDPTSYNGFSIALTHDENFTAGIVLK